MCARLNLNCSPKTWFSYYERPTTQKRAEKEGLDLPDRKEDLESRTPLRLAMGPEDHARAYVYLASDRARGVTGVIVNSDGGIGVRG